MARLAARYHNFHHQRRNINIYNLAVPHIHRLHTSKIHAWTPHKSEATAIQGDPPPPRGALSPSTAQKSAAPTTAFGLDLLQRAPQSLAHISSPRLDECKISITNKRLGIRKRPSNLTPIEEGLPESSHPKKPKKGQSKQPLLRAEPPSLINGLPGGPPTAWTRLREGGDIKIITHNVNGIRARLKDDKKSASNGFLSMLHDQKPDMIFLQEFRCPTADFLAQKDVKEALAKLDYRLLLNNTSTDPNAGYAGVAVLSRIPAISWGGGIDDSSTAFNLDAEGRLLWVNVGGLIIVNVYAPNSGTPGQDLRFLNKRLAFDRLLCAKVEALKRKFKKPMLLLGDLNVTRDTADVYMHLDSHYWENHPACTQSERSSFEKLLLTRDFIDVQRHTGKNGHTFWRNKIHKQSGLGMRLDYMLAEKKLLPHIRNFEIMDNTYGSDHAALCLSIAPKLFSVPCRDNATSKGTKRLLNVPALQSLASIFEQAHGAHYEDARRALQQLDNGAHLSPESFDFDEEDPPSLACAWLGKLASPTAETISLRDWPEEAKSSAAQAVAESAELLCPVFCDDDEEECISNANAEPDCRTLPEAAYRKNIVLPTLNVEFCDAGAGEEGSLKPPLRALADSGASSSLISRALAIHITGGKGNLARQIRKDLPLPRFRTADKRMTQPEGVLHLEFFIAGVSFTYEFYVLEQCAHDCILGSDFFDDTDALLDYGQGRIRLTSPLGGVAISPFKVYKTKCRSASASVSLFAEEDVIIAPGSVMETSAACDETYKDSHASVFGFITAPAQSKWTIPNASTRLSSGTTRIALTNTSASQHLCVHKGEYVGDLTLADPSNYDMYVVDLEKLGTSEDCFIDVVSLCEERSPHLKTEDPPNIAASKPVNLPRLTADEINRLSQDDLDALLAEAPIADCTMATNLTPEQLDTLKRLVLFNRDLFTLDSARPGQINVSNHPTLSEAAIETKDRAPAAFAFRPTMPHVRPIVEKHINEMLQNGIIRASTSPWGAALLLVPKKGGGSRFTVDFRLLNERTEKFTYSLPRMDDSVATLHGNKFFSTVDFTSAFFQVPLREQDKHKTAFRCHMGSFEFNVLPQGVVNGPSLFQKYVDTVLGDLRFQCCLAYADDCIIFSSSFDQHMIDLQRVLDQFRSVGFHISAKKSSFAMSSVSYLGHVVSANGIAPDPVKVAAINDSTPTSRAELRSWLGITGYYRRFVKNFSEVTRPLSDFINSRNKWTGLTDEMTASITRIKKILTTKPLLDFPDFSLPFQIHTDASEFAIGAALVQKVGDVEKVIQFISRILKPAEKNYHTYEKEALSVVWSISVFRPYVITSPFIVVTDNKAVTKLMETKQTSRLIKWVLQLQQYDITFVHRAGRAHANADALSRLPPPKDIPYRADDVDILAFTLATDTAAPPALAFVPHDRGVDFNHGFAFHLKPCSLPQNVSSCICTPSTCSLTDMEDPLRGEDPLPSRETLVTAQREDPALLKHITAVESGKYAPFPFVTMAQASSARDAPRSYFYLEEGLLKRATTVPALFCKKTKTRKGNPATVLQVCVPKRYRRSVLHACHGAPMSGHGGVRATQHRVREHFWWKNYERDVKAWCKSCALCQRRKTPQPSRQGLAMSFPSKRPFETCGFDIVGPLPEDAKGNKYLLTVVDHFTRYALAVPITNREQATIVHALHRHLVCVFGIPSRFVSDCEPSFTSAVTKGLFKLLGIEMSHTTPYHARTNGATERFHRFLGASLTMFVNTYKTDWSDYVDSLLFAYRTTVCSATGYSPFHLLFGRQAAVPPTVIYASPSQLADEQRRGISTTRSLQTVYKDVNRRQQKRAEANRRYRDKNRVIVRFAADDLVWKFDRSCDAHGPQKFRFRYSGPYVVQRQCSFNSNIYTILNPRTGQSSNCNVDLLVPVSCEVTDLGDPLGWTKGEDGYFPTPAPDGAPPVNEQDVADIPVQEGDMVALRMEPDLENLPFAVGMVIAISEDGEFTVWWYGNTHGNVLGAWRPGYFETSGQNRRYYADRRAHASHKRYTSIVSETTLTRDDVIGLPFQLNRRKALPSSVLTAAANDATVPWPPA